MQKLSIARDDSNSPTYAINLTDSGNVYSCKLDGSTTSSLVVPAGARLAVFGYSSGVDYWVSNTTFTVPSTNTFSALFAYLNPPPIIVTPGETLYFQSNTAATISVAFYG